jgi:hypothetical protein
MKFFKLISLAMHFRPDNQYDLDPTVLEMLRRELNPEPVNTENVIDLKPANTEVEPRKAA